MPFLYDIPQHVLHKVASDQAGVFGAIIKDRATGQIIAHMQPSQGLTRLLGQMTGMLPSGFNPLDAVALVQNEQIKRGISQLQNGMLLVQNLQYGTLALSGLGLGISVAGFAATLARLKAIEGRIGQLTEAVAQVTRDRRDDEIKTVLAEVGGDLQNIETLIDRRDPRPVAEQLQVSLTRSTRKIETHFRREADPAGRKALSRHQLELLWTLAGAMRLCQEAAVHALFMADDMKAAESIGAVETERQLALLEAISPDLLARAVARTETDPSLSAALRHEALADARCLTDGIAGGARTLAGQASLARALRDEGVSGREYLARVHEAPGEGLLCFARTAEA